MTTDVVAAPTATRRDLQLGRRLFHLANGSSVATAYALLFTHPQIVHTFGIVACIVYILDRIRIAYPEVLERHAPWVNRLLVRAEERVREAAMTPYAIAVLLTLIALPKPAALVAIYTLAIADPAAALVGITWGRRRLTANRSVEGSLAFFTATFAVTLTVFVTIVGAPWLPTLGIAMMVALASAAFELVPLRIDDNLTIPLFVGFATWIVAASLGITLG
jgi:glycerol-3-phosphate acyltransferase PlsY